MEPAFWFEAPGPPWGPQFFVIGRFCVPWEPELVRGFKPLGFFTAQNVSWLCVCVLVSWVLKPAFHPFAPGFVPKFKNLARTYIQREKVRAVEERPQAHEATSIVHLRANIIAVMTSDTKLGFGATSGQPFTQCLGDLVVPTERRPQLSEVAQLVYFPNGLLRPETCAQPTTSPPASACPHVDALFPSVQLSVALNPSCGVHVVSSVFA